MNPAPAAATAVTFVWLGMVLAISFVETPLKFRAPGVTLPIGLGIGRLVFRALNAIEVVLAVALVVATVFVARTGVTITVVVVVASLVAQLAVVRPRLSRRTDVVLAGADAPRSRSHYAYVGLELVKVAALVATGVLLLTA